MTRLDCCRDPENLEVEERRPAPDGTTIVRRCAECGRKHVTAEADAARVDLTGPAR